MRLSNPGPGNPILEDPIMVSTSSSNDSGTPHSPKDPEIMVDRMEDIQMILFHQGIPEEVTMVNIYHGLRRNTNKVYYYAWQKFARWCC
ncbi:hypothetical protein IWQ61_010304 [Dispira simplex]|nr:hypothetical protein IWQ61_010304 [Dispira simplex]